MAEAEKKKFDLNRRSMPKQTPEVRRRNFNEVALGYPAEVAIAEAKRCLQCKRPKCVLGCPVEIDIPGFIQCIADGDFAAGVNVLKDKNLLPAVCGRVCPQEEQCEKGCILNKKGGEIAIGRLERFLADWEAEQSNLKLPQKPKSTGKKVVVVGGGPAGLTVAGDLIKLGHQVTIFEALHEMGGVLVYGIPEFRLPKAIVKREVDYLKKLGVQIFRETPVEKILHDNHQVQGVVINGETINARNVVANSDVVTTFNQLIDGFPARRDSLNTLEPSLSGIVFLWGVSESHSGLAQHNVLFSEDYETEFTQIFQKKTVPNDPTIYITITSKADAHHAPANCENWFVMVNAPYLSENEAWTDQVGRTRMVILEKLKRLHLDIASSIVTEHVITPEDFYKKYGSNRGSIYGISSNDRATAFRRPANRDRNLKGLYFAGGSTHPGGGVPLTVLSGKMSAELLMERNT